MVRLTEQAEGLADELHGDRRLILLSVYFDAKKTLAQGRKVGAAQACANPILKDVAEVLSQLRIPWQFEDKAYSRNPTVERGRLRVVMRTEEDMPHNPDVTTRKALYKAVSRLLQEHPERKKRAAAAPAAPVLGLPALPPPAGAAAAAGAAGGGSSKKNNKKGKK